MNGRKLVHSKEYRIEHHIMKNRLNFLVMCKSLFVIIDSLRLCIILSIGLRLATADLRLRLPSCGIYPGCTSIADRIYFYLDCTDSYNTLELTRSLQRVSYKTIHKVKP